MFFDKFTLSFLVLGVASVNAFTGTGFLESAENTVPCDVTCPRSRFAPIGVPADKILQGRASCCAPVSLAYNGHNIQAAILNICPSCNGSENITMSPAIFEQLGVDPTSVEQISPVVWNVLG
ncbi:hypothetical protein L218DRAFT_956181 [Marasmius fiardii PR-910]|nr:hypothetical protein L218DRAFT_956181 [Marasmius fiardii PR-910]